MNNNIKKLLTYLFLVIAVTVYGQRNLLPDTTGFCFGDSLVIELKQTFEKNTSTEWRSKSLGIVYNTKKIKVKNQSEKYFVKIVSGKNMYVDSTFVKVYFKPKLNIHDTALCKGKGLVLDAKNIGMRYLWSTDESTQKIKVENSGTYWVKVINWGCVITDTVKVKFLPAAVSGFSNEASFCLSEENKLLTIKTTPGTKILWNTGSSSPSIPITNEGTYWVKTSSKNCGEQVDSVHVKLKACDCEMILPNSFTPNEDNRNDYFFPVLQCDYSYFKITILDRWENTVFASNNVNAKWDGRFKGNLCPEEIYIYRIESIEKGSDKKTVRTGKISLFR